MFPPFNFFGNDAVKYIIEADDATSDNKGRFTFIFLLCSSPGGSMYVPHLLSSQVSCQRTSFIQKLIIDLSQTHHP